MYNNVTCESYILKLNYRLIYMYITIWIIYIYIYNYVLFIYINVIHIKLFKMK